MLAFDGNSAPFLRMRLCEELKRLLGVPLSPVDLFRRGRAL